MISAVGSAGSFCKMSLEHLEGLDAGPKSKGRSKSPESGPTPGGNSILIEVKDRCELQDK